MAKKLGKVLLFAAAAGSAAAAVYYYMQKKKATEETSETDDAAEGEADASEEDRDYVSLTPETAMSDKTDSPTPETGKTEETASEFTPLSDQLNQTAESEEETVEEFFNEETSDTEASDRTD